MGKGGRKKSWPRSWKQSVIVGGTLTVKGRGVGAEFVVIPLRVEAKGPAELGDRIEEAVVDQTLKQRPS